MVDAFVDSREPKSLKNKAKSDYGFSDQEMPQGDFYLPEHDVAIERKEASDFASSTTEGRLSEQADRMVAEHEHSFLVLEGSPFNLRFSNVSAHSLIGMQTSLAVKRGVRIIFTEDVDHTLYAVNRIFERFMDEEHEQAESGYVKTADTGEVDDVQVAMLMQIDGISEEKARDILELNDFGYYTYMVVNDETEVKFELSKVDGIGDTLAERVINAFDA